MTGTRQLQLSMSVAEMQRRHILLLLCRLQPRGQFFYVSVEGLIGKRRLEMKKAYGSKSHNVAEVPLLHAPGSLPTP
jgi:hypothetical protein